MKPNKREEVTQNLFTTGRKKIQLEKKTQEIIVSKVQNSLTLC